MAVGTLTKHKVSIVLIGKFEPDKAKPNALCEAGALSEVDAEAAEYLTFVPAQIAHFRLPWGIVQVTSERLHVESTVPPFVRTADLALKILKDISPSAQVSKFGINSEWVVSFASADERDAFGVRLAPPANWGPWGRAVAERIKSHDKLHGGVALVTMRESPLEGRTAGYRDVAVSAAANTGAFLAILRINDHFEHGPEESESVLSDDERVRRTTARLTSDLQQNFEAAIDLAQDIARGIVNGHTDKSS